MAHSGRVIEINTSCSVSVSLSLSRSQHCLILTYQAMCQASLQPGARIWIALARKSFRSPLPMEGCGLSLKNNEISISQIVYQLTGLK